MPFCQHLAFRRPVGRWSGVRSRPIRTASRTAPFADLLLVWGSSLKQPPPEVWLDGDRSDTCSRANAGVEINE